MALDDLDLEFEDEEELKRKKNDAVHVDVDLEFQAPQGTQNRITRPPSPQGVVRKIDDARAAQAQNPRPAPVSAPSRPAPGAPRSVGSSALKEDTSYEESQEIVQLREQVRKVEFDASVRVQVAEFKTELLSEMLSDMKLMEHQIGQLLGRMHAKHPDLKNEALMIKKILADFTTKKRK